MFISKAEKKYLFDTIRILQQKIDNISEGKFWGMSSMEAAEAQENEKEIRKRRRSITPHGSLTEHAKPYLNNLVVGQFVEIPSVENMTASRIQKSVCSLLNKELGTNTFKTKVLPNGNLYVRRIA